MNKHPAPEQQPSSAEAIQWTEEWLSPDDVIRTQTLQVRRKLNPAAVRQYRDMTRAGSAPPLVKVAAVTERGTTRHYLVDGWHRWEADALVTHGSGPTILVRVLAAPMSMAEAAWVAAAANLNHGVQLKRSEMVEVFKAYVRARKHRTREGYRSYREMAADLGTPKSTLARWMHKHFHSIASRMGGEEGTAPGGLRERPEPPSLSDEVLAEVKRVKGVALSLPPEEKRRVHAALRELLEDLGKPEPVGYEDEF
ncbi:MAG: hypothetical protein IIA02_12255 [Proteobacteria bacterium]|uniref:hypothetical protein n=1 Tax=Aquabacterium sp. TaxID=1872578 RepID=UPI0035C662B5|nr:hypothetical protein [Pseudomonadota bacterium]